MLYGNGTSLVSIASCVRGSMTVRVAPFMLLTYSFERSQSGEMCSGAEPAEMRSTTSNVAGSMTAMSLEVSFGTYTRAGRSATRGSITPLAGPA